MENKRIDMSGKIYFHFADRKPLDIDSIQLLEKVDIHGSIARTAREVGISYPKVWHTIDTLNKMSEKPLVLKSAGGKGGGGGTILTEEGRKFLKRFKSIQRTHKRFIRQLEDKWASGR
jgi:molybdate transport system regulatory protein